MIIVSQQPSPFYIMCQHVNFNCIWHHSSAWLCVMLPKLSKAVYMYLLAPYGARLLASVWPWYGPIPTCSDVVFCFWKHKVGLKSGGGGGYIYIHVSRIWLGLHIIVFIKSALVLSSLLKKFVTTFSASS